MPNYANLCKIMHAIDPILFGCLRGVISKTCVKFLADPIGGFSEGVVQIDKEREI
jgi:hypothetical protein